MVVIAISVKKSLNEPGLEKVWIAFGQGGNFRLIPVHELVNTIGPEKASGLPFFHVMRQCLLSVAKERSLHGKHGMSVKGS